MKIAPPRLSLAASLHGVWRRATQGGRADSRGRRYLISAMIGFLAVWGAAGAYLVLSPKTYTSTMTLVLPGMGAGASVNLDSIGSASSTTASAFSSPDLSPTENYRKFLLSHLLLSAAAREAGDPAGAFPAPRVDLADQTKLITVSVTGRTPEQATRRAEAIRTVFGQVLDTLRQEELDQRDATYQRILGGYQTRLQEARQRLIEQQARTGLVSIEQYNSIVGAVERLRDQARDLQARLALGGKGIAELTRLLGVTPEMAATATVLRADPIFQALLETMAKQSADIATQEGIHGPANPRLSDSTAERDAVLSRLVERGSFLTGLRRADLLKLRDLSLHEERAQLFARLLNQVVDTNALTAQLAEITAQIDREQKRVVRLADDASHLENLRRDVQVAEAVFSSSLARIDTSKSDFFASYPMVQTFEAPLVPITPSSPSPVLAIGGGLGASFLILAALVLSWLRIALFRKILRNA